MKYGEEENRGEGTENMWDSLGMMEKTRDSRMVNLRIGSGLGMQEKTPVLRTCGNT